MKHEMDLKVLSGQVPPAYLLRHRVRHVSVELQFLTLKRSISLGLYTLKNRHLLRVRISQ